MADPENLICLGWVGGGGEYWGGFLYIYLSKFKSEMLALYFR